MRRKLEKLDSRSFSKDSGTKSQGQRHGQHPSFLGATPGDASLSRRNGPKIRLSHANCRIWIGHYTDWRCKIWGRRRMAGQCIRNHLRGGKPAHRTPRAVGASLISLTPALLANLLWLSFLAVANREHKAQPRHRSAALRASATVAVGSNIRAHTLPARRRTCVGVHRPRGDWALAGVSRKRPCRFCLPPGPSIS